MPNFLHIKYSRRYGGYNLLNSLFDNQLEYVKFINRITKDELDYHSKFPGYGHLFLPFHHCMVCQLPIDAQRKESGEVGIIYASPRVLCKKCTTMYYCKTANVITLAENRIRYFYNYNFN